LIVGPANQIPDTCFLLGNYVQIRVFNGFKGKKINKFFLKVGLTGFNENISVCTSR
jgi:hypothetical protein